VPRRPETLSPRERVRLCLAHQETDRVPMALICSGFEGTTGPRLAAHLGVDAAGLARWLEPYLDIAVIGGEFRGPWEGYRGPALGRTAEGEVEDIWGVWRKPMWHGQAAYQEICRYPLAEVKEVADLARHRFPDPDWWDYSIVPGLIAQATARRDYALCVLSGNPFELTWWMRGYEQTLFDMVEQPELFHAIMTRVTDFHLEQTRRILAAADRPIELAFTADDIAWQRGLMMSLPMWEAHLKPYHMRLSALIHEFGTKVIYHSDGGVMEAIPGLMDAGIDVLQALQFSADGMDPVVMKERYGDRLCFQGGISVQTTLPFGTVEEVRNEVREYVRILGRGGGYILGPSHAIQSGTPPDNIAAMFEEAAAASP
jgi:uroporphyrinogen decarboxylase